LCDKSNATLKEKINEYEQLIIKVNEYDEAKEKLEVVVKQNRALEEEVEELRQEKTRLLKNELKQFESSHP